MRPAPHAEWTKLRTVRGPLWLLLATVVVTVALSAGAVSVAACGSAGCGDPTRLSLTGVQLGQAPVVVLAVLVMATEYGTLLRVRDAWRPAVSAPPPTTPAHQPPTSPRPTTHRPPVRNPPAPAPLFSLPSTT
ncbi:hypothetical protein [Streptomyces sp. NPDC001076]